MPCGRSPGGEGRQGESLRQHYRDRTDRGGFYRRHPRAGRLYPGGHFQVSCLVLTEHDAGKLQAVRAPGACARSRDAEGKRGSRPLRVTCHHWLSRMGRLRTTPSSSRSVLSMWHRSPNKEQLKPADVPNTMKIIADPKWKDKIVMSRTPPPTPTTISWLVGLKENRFRHRSGLDELPQGARGQQADVREVLRSHPGSPWKAVKTGGDFHPQYIVTKAPAPLDWVHVDTLLGHHAPWPSRPRLRIPSRSAVPRLLAGQDAMKLRRIRWANTSSLPESFRPSTASAKSRSCRSANCRMRRCGKWGDEFKKIFFAQ